MAGGAGTICLASKSLDSPGVPNELIIDNQGLPGAATPVPIAPTFALTVTGGAVGVPLSPFGEIMLDSLVVSSNAVITASGAPGVVAITVTGDAVVETNGSISLDGLGCNAEKPGPGAGEVATNSEGSGGGYGGAGGASAGGAPGGVTYGSAQQPSSSGSEGGGAFTGDPNLSQGGGVLELDVSGALTINGTVSANGNAGLFPGAGGGAGGSVWLTAGTLSGQGVIRANGGAGQGEVGGGGGGGRIAIYAPTNDFAGVTTASGGVGFASGQPGTIFISTNSSAIIVTPTVVLIPNVEPNGSSLNLQWTGIGGVSYQPEFSHDLIHWQPYGPPILSSSASNSLVVPIGLDSATFVRLVLTN
jgi:hypothetical protein